MLRVPIEQTKPGMVLARSVATPNKLDHVLLKAGFELDTDHIQRLKSFNIANVWVIYPGLDFLDELLDPQLIEQQKELHKSLKTQFCEVQEQGLTKIDYNDYVTLMTRMFKTLLSSNKSSLFVTELQGESEDILLHGIAVASLSLLIGLRLENYLLRTRSNLSMTMALDLTQLGVGALLHDMGKLKLPEELRNFHITAHDMGTREWQKHTEIGLEMIKGGLDACAAQVVLNHHQHYDGSGFPFRKTMPGSDEPNMPLMGDDIHIFCRIACVADRFEGFRYLPDGRKAPTIVALKRMKNPGYVKWFDPTVYRAFTEAMPAFAPGDQVILNNGQTGVVTEINDDEPCRPIVRPIDPDKATRPDQKNSEAEDDTNDIDLMQHPEMHIARIGDFDVTPFLH